MRPLPSATTTKSCSVYVSTWTTLCSTGKGTAVSGEDYAAGQGRTKAMVTSRGKSLALSALYFFFPGRKTLVSLKGAADCLRLSQQSVSEQA